MDDGILAYISTMLQLVGGALRLDPAAFQAVFDYSGNPTLLIFWIVLIAGVSRMFGQSVVLFANRVKPARFAVSLVLGGLSFVFNVFVLVFVVWAMANLLGQKYWDLFQIGRAVGLATAVFWLSFLVLIPYIGLIWEHLLKVYLFLA